MPIGGPQLEHRLAVIAAARNLSEAAKTLGVDRSSLAHWCKAHKVPYAVSRGAGPPFDEAAAEAAYRDTTSDRQAARRLGTEDEKFRKWRTSQGLPAKGVSFASLLTDAQRQARVAEYRKSTSIADFAHAIGISRASAAAWLGQQGLPHPGDHRRRALQRKQFGPYRSLFLEAYQATDTDLEGARRVGVPLTEFRQWRTGEGLPPKTVMRHPGDAV